MNTYSDLLNVIKFNSLLSDAQYQNYEIEVSTRVPFRENVLVEAPESFFDINKPLNGLNQKATNYSGINGYEVRTNLELVILAQGVETIYNLISPEIRIFDYEELIT